MAGITVRNVHDVDREATWRENRRLQTRLYAAELRQSATVGGDRLLRSSRPRPRVVLTLAEATGCGKSFIACALAHAASRNGHAAL